MFFRQVLHEDLGCASYVVADGGQAVVIDPKWDVEDYLRLAEEHDFAIAHVLETHNHADHVSGKGRLAKATGATIHVPATAGVDFAHEPLADVDAVRVGEVAITALATPGHRPEHTAYLIADESRGAEPWLVVTGDSLFVGDVARPDLAVDKEEGARGIFDSLGTIFTPEGRGAVEQAGASYKAAMGGIDFKNPLVLGGIIGGGLLLVLLVAKK